LADTDSVSQVAKDFYI